MNKRNANSDPTAKELTCDEYISYLEEKLNGLKQIRQQFLQKKILPAIYEEQTMKSIQQLQHGLDGVRHTFLPLAIPPYLQISPNPPKWISLSESQKSTYANYSAQNDVEQKEMLRRFRRPGMRRADIQRAALLLSTQQNKVLEQMKWNQADFLVNVLITNVRMKINPSDNNYSNSLLKEIKNCIEENRLDYPTNDDLLSLFIMSLFDDDGPLNSGYPKAKNIEQEVSYISTTIYKYAHDFTIDKIANYVMPYVANIHRKDIIPSLAKNVQKVTEAIKDAYDILGKDASMADFGVEGTSSIVVSDGLKEIQKADSVESIVNKFQQIGDDAISGAQNSKKNASLMIAANLISANLVEVPKLFVFAIAWCSDTTLEYFKNKPLYVMAFDALLNVLSDFGE